MNPLVQVMLPELILIVAACVLFLMGMSAKAGMRRAVPVLALLALVVAFVATFKSAVTEGTLSDPWNTFRVFEFAQYIKLLSLAVGMILILLAWPTNPSATGGTAVDYGLEVGEFFALMLLSIAGILIVAGANDIVLLFLGIELAAIPTYIMVSVSRPLAVAQEAGVKYFFLGAMAAAIMLFGFSYLYGTTGLTKLDELTQFFTGTIANPGADPSWTSWQMLAALMLFGGFAFKMAAVPLHFYAGDVYQGAATPVTAFLAFVPKTAGIVALIKILYVVSGGFWNVPPPVEKLLWVLAVLSMTFGNVLGLLQFNVKRVLAYSSVAHSGYMLVGLTALVSANGDTGVQETALAGVLFYLAAYGIMNAGAFAVLMLLPSREDKVATSAETFEDLAGQGRKHPGLGLAMAVCCFSLTGLPLTIGFFGKVYLILPAWKADLTWLVVLMMINAAISAAYYLRIVAAMFLRPETTTIGEEPRVVAAASPALFPRPVPVLLALALSVAGTLLFGTILPATQVLDNAVRTAVVLDQKTPTPQGALDPEPQASAHPLP